MLIKKLFKETIRNTVRWALDLENPNNHQIGAGSKYANVPVGGNSIPVSFNFSITPATGGKVIVVRHYDHKTDRHHENVYIITDNQCLGEELAQIITRESLSK